MCGRLDCYLESFANLQTGKNKNQWSLETCFRAPHKPFLLLSILDQIASSHITRNFISPSFELAETFDGYWSQVMPVGTLVCISLPFYNLHTNDFWELVPQPGLEHRTGLAISSVKKLKELYLGAKVSDDLFPLLVMETSREKLRAVLVNTYFSPAIQEKLSAHGISVQGIEETGL